MAGARAVCIGRYALHAIVARGGMAQVHVGRLVGAAGFSKTVAIKRLFPHLTEDREFRLMLLDEARLASRVEHPNVVGTLDVVDESGELFIVMEFVRGVSAAELLRRLNDRSGESRLMPAPVAVAIAIDALMGLHAAHEARAADGTPLEIVHRDVSPHNVLVGADGRSRIADFGVAKAAMRLQSTRDGQVKGKLSYMAPEQFKDADIDRRVDVYAAGVVLWELLTGLRLFTGSDAAAVVGAILENRARRVSFVREDVAALEPIIMKAIAGDPSQRFATAAEMAETLRAASSVATANEVGQWVKALMADRLADLDRLVAEAERGEIEATAVSESSPAALKLASAAPTGRFEWDAGEPVPTRAATSTDVTPTTSRRVLASPLVIGSAVLALAASFFVVRAIPGPTSDAGSALPPPPAPTSATAVASAGVGDAAVVETPAAAAVEIASASAASAPRERAAPARASVPPRPAKVRPAPAASPSASKSAPSSECDPPFTIDERGVKHFKRGCM